ncbi:MAG: transglycosylase SLT domain-containing protein [Acidimicrobiales bacterium]
MMQLRLRSTLAAVASTAVLGTGALSAFSAAAASYTVRRGDTASSIAARFNVTLGALVAANHLANANLIHAGERLRIPGVTPSVVSEGAPTFPRRLLAHPERLALLPSFRTWAPGAGVPTGLLEAMAWMESGWQRDVVSSTGAIGVAQLEPSTVTFVCTQLLGLRAPLDAHDPDANIRMGATYLGWLLRATRGDVGMALGGYYQGLASMRSRGPLLTTRAYIDGVRSLWSAFGAG